MNKLSEDMKTKLEQLVRLSFDERVRILKEENKTERIAIANTLPVSSPESGAFLSAMQVFVCKWLEDSVAYFWSRISELVQYVDNPTGLAEEIEHLVRPEVDHLERIAFGTVFSGAKKDTEKEHGPSVKSEIESRGAAAWAQFKIDASVLGAKLENEKREKEQDRRWQIKSTLVGAAAGALLGAGATWLIQNDRTTEPPAAVVFENPANVAFDEIDTTAVVIPNSAGTDSNSIE